MQDPLGSKDAIRDTAIQVDAPAMETNGAPAAEHEITCLIADDHPAILDSIAGYLREEGINVVGRTRTGRETLRVLERRGAQVALIDLRLPDLSGIEVAREAARIAPDTAILIYTGYAEDSLVREALDVGVRGIILKEAPLADLPRAIALVAGGGSYLDPLLGGALATADPLRPQLTVREREVLRLLADGHTNEEIGAYLFLSPETVRTHVHKAVRRLGVRNRTEAVAKGLREGLIA
jgi:DNA-binding NarL/FixJ family response regulator